MFMHIGLTRTSRKLDLGDWRRQKQELGRQRLKLKVELKLLKVVR